MIEVIIDGKPLDHPNAFTDVVGLSIEFNNETFLIKLDSIQEIVTIVSAAGEIYVRPINRSQILIESTAYGDDLSWLE